MSGDFLADMAASSRERVAATRSTLPEEQLLRLALASPVPPRLQLSSQGFDIISEVKLRSPAAGALRAGSEAVGARVVAYANSGAAAISVLTEPDRFDGSMQHLEQAVAALGRSAPAMRKDFIVDPYQVMEARLVGAGGVLAILRMLPLTETKALVAMATRLRLFVLLEAFDEADLELAREILADQQAAALAANSPLLVGINCRDLVTLKVVPGRLEQSVARMPANAPRVAESGLESADDAARLVAAGYNMALIGSALMRSAQPAVLLGDMLRAGRAAGGRGAGVVSARAAP
jgi:indole-3-glycerol phosphate synthase